jgi:hypothetical protein
MVNKRSNKMPKIIFHPRPKSFSNAKHKKKIARVKKRYGILP